MQTCTNTGYCRNCDCKVRVLIKKIKQLIFQHLDLYIITPFSILLFLKQGKSVPLQARGSQKVPGS